ncbi:MAG: hypothetical protein AAFS10_11525 [Myxococcota bacterium]
MALATGTLLWVLLGVPPASGQCLIEEALPGSVAYRLARDAQTTNAKTYGAVGTLERRILPQLQALDDDEDGFLLYLGGDAIYDVAQVPVRLRGCSDGFGTAAFDLNSYNLGFGARVGWLTLFYTAGAQSGSLAENNFARGTFTTLNFFTGHYYNIAAPAFGAQRVQLIDDGVSSLQVDYIAGLGVDLDYIEATVGYVGSTGLYGSLDQSKLRLFARALIQEADNGGSLGLNYLRAGKDAFDWWNAGGAQGTTTTYVRKVRLALPGRDDLTDAVRDQVVEALDLWTVHVEQRDILTYFDLTSSYAWTPEAEIHEFKFGAHSPGYNTALNLTQLDDNRRELWPIEFAAYVGTVQLPRMTYYGVTTDDARWTTAFDLLFLFGDRDANIENGFVRFRAMRNDPEVLDIFPYGIDAWQFHLSVQGMTKE